MSTAAERIQRTPEDIEKLRQWCESNGHSVVIIDGVVGVRRVYTLTEWVPLAQCIDPRGEPLSQCQARIASTASRSPQIQ